MAYLFAHFRETYGEEGEQVYFALSRDGYVWEAVNNGRAVLTATKGDLGVRDIVIARVASYKFVIMATDLALRRNEATKYKGNIRNAFRNGSKCLAMWKSNDLVNWSEEILLDLSNDRLGCLWAPGIFYDEIEQEYIVHWSSASKEDGYSGLSIYCSHTRDFEEFSAPELFYQKEDSETLDSCIVKQKETYHLFVKSAENPKAVIHETASSLKGPYIRDIAFDEQMDLLIQKDKYEAPTTYELADGKICLLMDFYGCKKEEQGYVPFFVNTLDRIKLENAQGKIHFPYGFKHGTVLKITNEEYERVKQFHFSEQ